MLNINYFVCAATGRSKSLTAGWARQQPLGCTAFPAPGSFAGLSRKCAWSGCSSPPISSRFQVLSRSSAPSTPLLTYFYPRSTLKLTTTLSEEDRGDRSASCAPNAVNHSFNIVDFCRDSTKFKRA